MLFDNYDLLMDSPNSTVKMRKLILQLAVQGKLVEQDPNDEPASALLKKIRLENKKLIKEGKTKKQSPLPPINTDEMPFELPDNWEWSRFGELVDFFTGKTPSTKDSTYWSDGNDGYPWISISDMMDGGWVGETKRRISDKAVREVFKCSSVDFGTLIMSFKLTLGKVSFIGIPAYHNEAIIAIYPHTGVLKDFLLKALPLLVTFGQSKDAIKGRTLNKNSLTLLGIPLPPFAEQKRIISKVDQLMQLCDQLDTCQKKASTKYESLNDAALEKLLSSKTIDEFANHWQFICNNFDLIYNDPAHVNKLRQAILQLAVQGKLAPQDPNDEPASELLKRIKAEKEKLIAEGKIRKQKPLSPITENEIPYELPQCWEWVRLGNIVQVSSGDGLTSKNMDTNGTIPVYGGNGITGYHNKHNVNKQTIVIGRVGYHCGSIHLTQERAWVTDNAFITKFPETDIDQDFLIWLLKGTDLKKNENATAQPVISGRKIYPIIIGIPSLAEQKRIVSKVNQLMHLCDELEDRLNQSKKDSEMLMHAVLQEAFAIKQA